MNKKYKQGKAEKKVDTAWMCHSFLNNAGEIFTKNDWILFF